MRKGIWAGKIFIRWCRLFFEDYLAAEILKIIVKVFWMSISREALFSDACLILIVAGLVCAVVR